MKQVLINFLSQFKEFNEKEILELSELLQVKAFPKNTLVVKEGQSCNLCYFVLSGCLRQYIIQDAVEKTTAIYTEHQAINYYTNLSEQTFSDNYLSCIEDSILMIGDPEKDAELFKSYPVLLEITRKMLEADLGKTQQSLAKVLTSNPEQRYLNLLQERPDLLQRVPQNIIASYLGITPESLSRIRKRIVSKK